MWTREGDNYAVICLLWIWFLRPMITGGIRSFWGYGYIDVCRRETSWHTLTDLQEQGCISCYLRTPLQLPYLYALGLWLHAGPVWSTFPRWKAFLVPPPLTVPHSIMAKGSVERKKSVEDVEEYDLPQILKWMGKDWAQDPRLASLLEEKYQPYIKYGEQVWWCATLVVPHLSLTSVVGVVCWFMAVQVVIGELCFGGRENNTLWGKIASVSILDMCLFICEYVLSGVTDFFVL